MEGNEMDLNSICRLCMQQRQELVSIFHEESSRSLELPLSKMITNFAPSIKVEINDELPSQICEVCLQQLNISYDFKRQCEHSDAVLRKHIQNLKNIGLLKQERPADSQESMAPEDTNGVDWSLIPVKTELKDDAYEDNGSQEEVNRSQYSSDLPSQQLEAQKLLSGENHNVGAVTSAEQLLASTYLGNFKFDNSNLDARKRFACIECGKHFVQKQHLVSHMRTHTGEKPYKCTVCGKAFAQSVHLKNHHITHTRLKPFRCNECGKCFAQNIHLKNHLSTHTGEKPYTCTLCGKNFAQNVHLKNHLSTHTGIRPFSCKICGKSFSQNVHLKNHQLTHSDQKPFRCNECGKTFAQNIHLKNHLSTHTGEKPFGCSECGKHFARSGQLKEHLKLHSGVKPFKCEICNKCFTQNVHLKNHLATHSNDGQI